jgi:serine/threonine-protein kinase
VAFFTGNLLRKIPVAGGNPTTLATVERPSGALWHSPDRILLFQFDGFQLRWISAAGGGQDSTIALRTQFGTPGLLPGGEWVVGRLASGQLAMLSLTDATQLAITRRGVIPLDSVRLPDLLFGFSPHYVPTGHLVFGGDDGVLFALPFDPDSRRVSGEPVPIVTGVRIEEGYGFAEYALAEDGTLVYVPGVNQLYGVLAYVGRDGRYDTIPFPRGQYTQPRLSPDGTRLALQQRLPIGGWDVVVMDLESGVRQRVPVAGNYRVFPASWMPDGRSLMLGLWTPVLNTPLGFRIISLDDGTTRDLDLVDGSYVSVAPNGRDFVFSNWRTGDLFVRAIEGDTARRPIPARGFAAGYSPDGKWVAWGGADGGVAVSPIPPTGAIYPVVERGQQPLFDPNGNRIIYRDGRRFYEVPYTTTSGFRTGRPTLLSEGPFLRTFAWNHTIGPDGRLAALLSAPGDETRELGVITGFDQELIRLAPTRRTP